MSTAAWAQLGLLVAVLAAVVPLLARYLVGVQGAGPARGDRLFLPAERLVYRLAGIDPGQGQRWTGYARSVVAFSTASVLLLYLVLRLQGALPFNPTDAPGMPPALAFNTAVSFVTGTNWQAYAGESSASHLSQMLGLVVAQFTAAAVGMSVAYAVVRGVLHRLRPSDAPDDALLGNFWVDLTRNIVRVLLPAAVIGALVLVSQGAVQNLKGNTVVTTLEGATQVVPGGPVASQEVIKLLGTNGGGFYNSNSAHPFENPTGLASVWQLVLVLAIPFAFPLMFGQLARLRRQGYTILAVMALLWIVPVVAASYLETDGTARLDAAVADESAGNMEGKEVRQGEAGSAQLAVGTMGTSAGVASSALDSYTPLGGAMALGPILLGEVSPGGVGSGLYGMLVYAVLAVFIGGLMVGRTPELLGKKIQAAEMKVVSLYLLTLPAVILAGTGATVVVSTATSSALNPGTHGMTEMLYAFGSAADGNGSAFAGLSSNTDWYNSMLGVAMLAGRFLLVVPVLAMAGSLARRRTHAPTTGTVPTSGPTFGVLLLGVVVLLGGLTYLPAFVVGPIAEHVSL